MELSKLLDDPLTQKFAVIVAVVVAMWLVRRLASRLAASPTSGADARYRVRKAVFAITWIATLLVAAILFEEQFAKEGVVLGLAAAGVAVALQEIVVSVAGWLANSFGGYYAVGDRVQIGGVRGDVIDIGVVRTTLMEVGEWIGADQYTGRIVCVPNSMVFKDRVVNYSGDFKFLWDEIKVPIHQVCDVAMARAIFVRVLDELVGESGRRAAASWTAMAAKYRVEATTTSPTVFLVVTDNWYEFSLRYVVDYGARRSTKDRIFTRIVEELAATNGRVALASTTIEILPAKPAPKNDAA